jgi:prevent-host-death family protein
MKRVTVSVRDASRGFTRLLREVAQERAVVTVTLRAQPVAVLCPYGAYQRLARRQSLRRLLALSDAHLGHATLAGTYRGARRDLQNRGRRPR